MFGRTSKIPKRVAGSVVAAALLAVAACDQVGPTATSAHQHASIEASQSEIARVLNDLRKASAAWHNLDKAAEDGYAFNIGCIDERVAGEPASGARGMGYHFAGGAAFDDFVDLVRPELLVYGRHPESGKLKLAGFDYFIPVSATYPAPEDDGTPPQFEELLDIPFTWMAAFQGWMLHIWPWWHNPDGMFDNFNSTVPLCECELSPEEPLCFA